MFQTELSYFIVLSLVILFSQFVPTAVLTPLDNVIVRIGVVILLLFLITLGPTAGILGFVTIAILYLERNRRKVSVALQKLDQMDIQRPPQATVEEASQPQKTVPVNEFDAPKPEETDYFSQETCDSGDFEPVAPTINEKAVLATIYPLNKNGPESGTGSNSLFEKLGFGHIPGLETIGDSA
jgi:hypothetical protein